MTRQEMHDQTLDMVRKYCDTYHNVPCEFKEGDRIPYASRVYDHEEMVNLVDSALEFWLTAGRYVDAFEKVVRIMHDNDIGYGAINHPVDRDPVCGYVGVIKDVCPRCGRHESEGVEMEKVNCYDCCGR